MRKMVQGTEHEYTLYCRKMGTMGFDPHMMALDLLRDSDLHLAGEFITNGSRVYYDVGHFEVSTAETTNFHDVVIWEKAGEKVLDWLRRVMEEKYTGDMKIHAFKNNTSPDGTSYGSHENYCVSRDVPFPDQYVRDLVPHLSTRIIYTGAGSVAQRRDPESGAVEGRAGGRPGRLSDRHPAILPREDRVDRGGRLGAPCLADVRRGLGRPREPALEGAGAPDRVARSVVRDPGGRREEGRA